MIKNKISMVVALTACAFLTACEPNDAEIKSALEKDIVDANKGLAAIGNMVGGKDMKIEIVSAKKIACKEAQGNPGYVCDVSYEVNLPVVGKKEQTSNLRFVKGDKGWEIMN